MKILLIGATGMVGSRILNEAISRGHEVIAATRGNKKLEFLDNVVEIVLDVNDSEAVAEQASNVDVIVSAVSPRNTEDAFADAVTFTQSLIAVYHKIGKRILMVGGGSSLNMPDGTNALDLTPEGILPEASGMRRAYGMMVHEDINFTVLAPAGIIEPGERTGKFRLGGRTMLTNSAGGKGNISAEDFAVAMLDEIEEPKHFRTIFNVGY
ncbi:NAD(P)-dependent oxidoreductase [Agarilytica rhodophyticola]|uniref:NAD(P)-dependent oxidoreductase n=1 Tax=Agarilytica rhodophyticola TaxID=1737490 RepID=UPI000B344838|nr:NAD(P)H-binding protein [Agarilytica rhodophyticola]